MSQMSMRSTDHTADMAEDRKVVDMPTSSPVIHGRARRIGRLAVTLALAMAASGCGSNTSDTSEPALPRTEMEAVDFDYSLYQSVESLHRDVDRVLEGTIGRVVSREVDYGSDPIQRQMNRGLAMEFRELTLADSSEIVVVAQPDPLVIQSDEVPLAEGDNVVVFGKLRTPETAPGISSVDFFYVPLGGPQGIFDVSDGRATSRSNLVRALTDAEAIGVELTSSKVTFGTSELLQP